MRAWIIGLSILFAFGAGAARAAEASAAEPWRALTRGDVEAAYALLRDNHPGATAEANDPAFTAALARAHDQALARAAKVEGHEGYVATLGAFAGALGDGHIGSGPRFLPRTVRWAGLVAARRGDAWIVAGGDPAVAGGDFTGARIEGCDGQPADVRARTALGFRADASSAATQVLQGVWLLVDEGNPFLPAPHACTLDQGGKPLAVTLHWVSIDRGVLLSRWWKRPYGAAGFGVRPSGAGIWIGLQALDPRAQPVLDAVEAQADAIRAAPYVVVDLRGDGGGDDGYAWRLAEAMYGPAHVAAVLGASGSATAGCPPIFRASADNIAAFVRQAAQFQASGDAEGAREYEKAIQAMTAARAAGRALTGD
ncbi:MAG TPA: hypothetical protein VFH92_05485, partial [Phenylobacterium sp.]|nr:hypothetical protein [Phenylobacterium sp.]